MSATLSAEPRAARLATEPSGDAIADVDGAARRVLESIGTPLHERAVVAALESEGLRDGDADRLVRGCPDLFALGRIVYPRCLALAGEEVEEPKRAVEAGEVEPEERAGWRGFVSGYWRGLAYTLPLIVSAAALIGLGVSLWGSASLSGAEQTAIGLSVVASLILTGPVLQGMARRVYYYWFQEDLAASRRAAWRAVALGLGLGVAAAGAVAAWAAITGNLDALTLTLAAFLPLECAMWLAISALAIIRQSWLGFAGIVAATLLVWGGLQLTWPAVWVHIGGMAVADVLLLGGVWLYLGRMARGAPPARRSLPRSVLPLAVGGYVAWGIVYFLLLFVDRLVAWLGPEGAAFRPAYEAALQLALVPLLLVQPLLEIILVRLSGDLIAAQDARPGDLVAANRRVTRRFLWRVAGVTGAYCVLAVAVWLLVVEAGPSLPLGLGELVQGSEGRLALWAALMAYGCLTAALGLCAAFQLLSRPGAMVAAGAFAVAVNLTVGLVGRSVGPPGSAALGLLAGSAAFLAGMLLAWSVARRRLDHLWCTAF